jgi:hypothetical protein
LPLTLRFSLLTLNEADVLVPELSGARQAHLDFTSRELTEVLGCARQDELRFARRQ